jgi:hypothetical protein
MSMTIPVLVPAVSSSTTALVVRWALETPWWRLLPATATTRTGAWAQKDGR